MILRRLTETRHGVVRYIIKKKEDETKRVVLPISKHYQLEKDGEFNCQMHDGTFPVAAHRY